MAGGAGTRLWPLSRKNKPKQLLQLFGGKSLMEIAVDRLDGIFDPERIFIITNAEYADQVAETVPTVPRANIIGEPEGRDTANAIALGAAILAGRDESATMAVFTADHIIRPQHCFAESVNAAMAAAEAHPDALLTFGVKPTWPHTGLGYIECDGDPGRTACPVRSFTEKPDHITARKYVESGDYYWNSGMFVWTVSAIAAALERFMPESAAKLACVTKAVRQGEDYTDLLAKAYPTLEKISIDFAVMEKAEKVLAVTLNCEWLDMGSWPALEEVVPVDDMGNVIIAEQQLVTDGFRNILVSPDGHLLAVVGIDDCIVVHSPDATLICKKEDGQRLKELVRAIEEKFGKKYL
jgi:mannose-1-phosphate guanylyltransferase